MGVPALCIFLYPTYSTFLICLDFMHWSCCSSPKKAFDIAFPMISLKSRGWLGLLLTAQDFMIEFSIPNGSLAMRLVRRCFQLLVE